MFFQCFGRLQAVVSEAGVEDHPKNFNLSKVRAKSLKTWAKMAPYVV